VEGVGGGLGEATWGSLGPNVLGFPPGWVGAKFVCVTTFDHGTDAVVRMGFELRIVRMEVLTKKTTKPLLKKKNCS